MFPGINVCDIYLLPEKRYFSKHIYLIDLPFVLNAFLLNCFDWPYSSFWFNGLLFDGMEFQASDEGLSLCWPQGMLFMDMRLYKY